ncbi:hypothetical protein PR202_gb08324 [Eleusine coracana subsp. coracana]|uniref:Uncharacterized protein n=1 Tax=Eleusine coracana subsp. coracana TaxID=191504 RepID=A0AAV5EEB5_ELECO|nr:hypothetical protein PR202_gb08324 [Eleusine coracana subsp. coracana]
MTPLVLVAALALAAASAWVPRTAADPQTTLLNRGCSQYNATPAVAFLSALNSTFEQLRANLSAAGGDGFATAAEPRAAAPAFGMAQCRPYVTGGDCVACFDAAAARLRRDCGAANGGRVILDGCVVRYESATFYDQATLPGNTQLCDGSAVPGGGFLDAARALIAELAAAVPRAPGLAAAATSGGVYAAAQCVATVGEAGCAQCLNVAAGNIGGCPPNSDGRAVDAGCFMRYSNRSFFPANATVDLAQYLRSGDLLGATELRGPTSFYYHDLKVATNSFSEKGKLGEGGFGDVYKGLLKNGKTVAVKRLIVMETSRAKADFESEVKLISNVHHRNLVRLLGCSRKGSEFLLVYEYMANGSLDKFLFGMCTQIYDSLMFDACRVNATAILTMDFYAMVSFGFNRGYTAPEYAIHGQLSEKVDTYSFGVVVLEILSGRKSNDTRLEPETQYLLEWL